ncbi:hypothetical protein ABLE92_14550 [Gordonia sp. VNQ95]|jgi:hypothetical protein|uniref:PH domain-containing protein n=1 Tax=Gordonia TaxID=2053 RepID=UPI0032B535DE
MTLRNTVAVIWKLDVPVPYPAVGIGMALAGGLALLLIARPARQDTSAAFDDVWTMRTPRRAVVSYFVACGAFVLAGVWLLLLSGADGFADTTAGRAFPHTAFVLGILALAVFGSGGVFGLAVVLFAPHHTIVEVIVDDERLTVTQGFRRTVSVRWEDIVSIRPTGPERPAVASGVTVVYRPAGARRRRRGAQIFLADVVTGVESSTLLDILEVRWRPDVPD